MLRDAAVVVLYRLRPELEVYIVLRSRELGFFGGYHVFPGGAVEPDDGEGPLDGDGHLSTEDRAVVFAAARELFEETGVCVSVAGPPSGSTESFAGGLRSRGDSVPASAFRFLTRLITPVFSHVRFDTRFFLVETDEEPRITTTELESGSWMRPRDALDAWRRGEIYLAPPTLIILEHLWGAGPDGAELDAAVEALRGIPSTYEGSGLAIPWTPGVEALPLYTPPLPRSLPTSTFFLGERRFVVVDPGPGGEAEREHLFAAIEERLRRGHRPEAIVLTHHHGDHVGALAETIGRFSLPVWAHPITGKLLERDLDRELEDGDAIDLGPSPTGDAEWNWEVVFTPGHARGHIALWEPGHGALIAGDLISTSVSMFVGSPGGHLETYFRSLRRIRELPIRILYPAHGIPTLNAAKLIDRGIEHRHERIAEIEGVLTGELRSTLQVADEVYHDISKQMKRFYERATRATLEYLEENGRARRQGEEEWSRPLDA